MKSSRKIALVTGGLQFGGSTTFLLNLISGFKILGVSCAVFSLKRDNPLGAEFASLGVPVHIFDENELIFEDRLAAIYQELSRFQPDAVIANIGVDAYEILRYVPSGVTRIGMIHDLAMNPRRIIPLYQDALDGVATVNIHLQDDIKSAAPRVNCRYLSHGISLTGRPSPRNPNPDRPLKILFFGRLVEGKGTHIFPSIVQALHERAIPFQWTIHGQGPDENYLREQLAGEIAGGEVTLSTRLAEREELFPLIREHDVFIMASEIEGGPLTLLESMSFGLVPICNDIPCLAQEVVKPDNGFIIPLDPRRYAESLGVLHSDRALLERFSAAARQTITEHFSSEAMAGRYLAFLESFPTGKNVEWPGRIRPRPILDASGSLRLAQSLGILRPVRRLLKHVRSTTHL
jgi:glycosyltransferase involved in cell wall biosynthesis